jgi:S-layer family protein
MEVVMNAIWRNGWLMLAALALAAPGFAADQPVLGGAAGVETILAEPQPQPWGATSDAALVVGIGDVVPPSNTVTWATSVSGTNGLGVFQTSPTQIDWWYQFSLPAGAVLQRVELEACDTSTTAAIAFGIARGVAPAGSAANISAVATTGVAATPGCAFFSVPPTASTTINNAGNDYWVFFNWNGTGFGGTIHAHALRFYYRLQVSPAPVTATFPNDVPTTHPFFRFVEALAASGVTSGCGAGSYCPDAAITRGQMAVFLATALGMHFPN